MGPGLRVQPKASQKKVQSRSMVPWKWWTHPETLLLIEIWGHTLSEHCEEYKGKRILPSSAYEKIAERLSASGIKRSVGQIREKIKTLKKTYWGALAKAQDPSTEGAKAMSGKRASVIELMRRVLQANGNMVKGKYMRKNELVKAPPAVLKGKQKAQGSQGSGGGKRAKAPVQKEESESEMEEEEDEEESEDNKNEFVAGVDSGVNTMHGLRLDPTHVHGSSLHWNEPNHHPQQHHQQQQREEEEEHGACGEEEEEANYNYPPLCELVEGLVNKFLCGQRESEERFLLLEEKRFEAERKRWEGLQRKDEELLGRALATYDQWRKEDRAQEANMWASLLAANGATHLSAFDHPPHAAPVKWHLTGTARPEPPCSSPAAPSTSRRNN